MVKKEMKNSTSSSIGDKYIVNENGKRSAAPLNNDDKKRSKTFGLYRQPTIKELNRLQETETLFNSNLFRLQVEEVLAEVKVTEKAEKKFQKWFADFKNHLISIPEDETEYDLTEAALAKKLKVKLPICGELLKTKCIFKFHKFEDVKIVGSYALGCAINSKLCIDLQITVPADTYKKNDSINYRYHKKRAAYLAFVSSHLKKLDSIEDLHYSWTNASKTKPVIDLKPAGKIGNCFTVRINLACESEAYKYHRFSPSRNNLRESWMLDEETLESNSEIGPPTPYYNHSVLSDLTSIENQQFLEKVLSNSDNLKQAVVLLKIWLRQRKLQVSGHVICLFVAYLVQLKRINNIMSSYQIVRNVWTALKISDWDTKGISLHKETNSPPIEEFYQHFPVVFLDKTGYYNLCWNMCKGTYDALKRECSLAINMLDNSNINSFIPLFMTPVLPWMQFDHIIRFKNLPKLKDSILARAPKQSRLNYGVEELALVTNSLLALLNKGLGKRTDLILPLVDADFSWPVKKSLVKAKDGYEEKLSFGLILNPEHSLNTIEKGPSANLPEAEEFRTFWGEKSSLRRFQDGSITETCVWQGDTLVERRGVTRQIVDYLLKIKFDIDPTDVTHASGQFDSLLTRKQYDVNCEESCARALHAFDELRRDLRALTQLPLEINAVYGVSPVFSYCDPLPPLPRGPVAKPWQRGGACLIKDNDTEGGATCVPEYTPVCKAIVELGHSGKWPGEIEAFRCLKTAFNIQISQQLTTQFSLPTQAYYKHIDVLKSGIVFRLEIAHPKEITLLRREMENGVVKYKESEESVKLQRETVLLPRLRGALHGLHQKHPSYGPTACLLKRFLSSHLLSPPHIPSTLCDLLTATVFVHSAPLAPPTDPSAGLMRVLHKLANTDWSTEMVVLDFNEDMKREEITELERKFSERDVTQPPFMYIVTAYDDSLPSVWSETAPSAQVLARARQVASSAIQYMTAEGRDNLMAAFIPSYAGYDVLIHLHTSLSPYACERVDTRTVITPLPESVVEDIIPVVEFNPVAKYLDELRSAYEDFALFFHDSYGGEVIAVLWRPDIEDARELQLTTATALHPVNVKGEVQYKVNLKAIVEDFRILGRGLVRDITVNQ